MARCLASLGVAFSEEAVEPVTGYRVDMLLHDGVGVEMGRCVVEVDSAVCVEAVMRAPVLAADDPPSAQSCLNVQAGTACTTTHIPANTTLSRRSVPLFIGV